MTSRDSASLLDMVRAAYLVLEFTAGLNQVEFMGDRKTQSAVLYQIAIIGEAVKRLSQDFRSQHPQIAWTAMAGMRDKLIHDYEAVDPQRVWLTVETSIPEFLSAIEPLLPAQEDS